MSLLDRLGRRTSADAVASDAADVIRSLQRAEAQIEPVLVRLHREHAFPMRVEFRPERPRASR